MYREFNSEALRFLLPGASFWDEAGQPSFVGALHLGLRQRFGGKVDHLQSALGEEPQPGSQQRKTFLYLFDSVPGGTGYVRQLIESGRQGSTRGVRADRSQTLQACSCSDGCYRCIFMYRQRFDRERTSKRRAIEQLQTILQPLGGAAAHRAQPLGGGDQHPRRKRAGAALHREAARRQGQPPMVSPSRCATTSSRAARAICSRSAAAPAW